MAKKVRNGLLLAKVQVSAGVDAAPAAATNAILMRNITATPLVMEYTDRQLVRPFMGNSGQVPVAEHQQLEFEVELAGSGTAGTAPAWGPLLRGCGFAETLSAGVSAAYNPISTGFEMLTLHYNLDGVLHKMIDARGTVSFDVTAKGIPFMRFRFIGKYESITDAAMPSGVDFSAFKKPLGVNSANTPSWTLGVYTGCLQSLTIDIANQLEWRTLVGCQGAEINDRQPTGNLLIELPSIANLSWPNMVRTAANQAIALTHGSTAGNIVEFAIPTAQLTNPSYSDQNGTAMLGFTLNLQPDTGNDEVVITVK